MLRTPRDTSKPNRKRRRIVRKKRWNGKGVKGVKGNSHASRRSRRCRGHRRGVSANYRDNFVPVHFEARVEANYDVVCEHALRILPRTASCDIRKRTLTLPLALSLSLKRHVDFTRRKAKSVKQREYLLLTSLHLSRQGIVLSLAAYDPMDYR